MHENNNKPGLGSSSSDRENSFTVQLEPINSVFGISADTWRTLAASYNITPEALLKRAATVFAQADIPGLDLDSPELSAEQIEYLNQRRIAYDASTNSQQPTLAETFKRLIEGTGDNHENEIRPRDGGHT